MTDLCLGWVLVMGVGEISLCVGRLLVMELKFF